MTDREKQLRTDYRKEIRARELLCRRLAVPLKQAEAAGEKKRAARFARIDELSEYKTYEEAHEAYGYDVISEQEFYAICDALEHHKQLKAEPSPEENAVHMLKEFIGRLQREISYFRYEMLSPKEKAQLRKQSQEIQERHEKWKREAMGDVV